MGRRREEREGRGEMRRKRKEKGGGRKGEEKGGKELKHELNTRFLLQHEKLVAPYP